MAVRPRFDPKRPLVAARDFTFMGKGYGAGDPFGPFDPGEVAERALRRQYEARAVSHTESDQPDASADPVQMTESETRHTYLITAPWLEEPERVRGVKNAEKRLAELREAGPPVGYIEGGSEVTVEEKGGGWYEINAPWLSAPEKAQGREDAEARQLELHEAGAPEPEAASGDETEGGDPEAEEADVAEETEQKPEDGDKPNEPGTNQPNGAEVINDKVAAEPGNARNPNDDDGDGTEGGDGSTRPVGP